MKNTKAEELEVGYNIPAELGMSEQDIQTPCLIIDLDAFEKNVEALRVFCERVGISLRVHGKMHKSADVARYQIEHGKAIGICCQKVSEAEAFARGGIRDILITNQIRDPLKLRRFARIPKLGTRVICCVDDIHNVDGLSEAAQLCGTEIECLIELDCGASRCGVSTAEAAVEIAKVINARPGLKFSGLQAYNGDAQHLRDYVERKQKFNLIETFVGIVIEALLDAGLECKIVSGGGTGSFQFEGNSDLFTELQCGSYAFMDAAYGEVLDENDRRMSDGQFDNALFILTSIMSCVKPGRAICDAGLKIQSVDSGLPMVFRQRSIEYVKCSDEHGVILDPREQLKINDKLRLVPGHCDPTCNLHDWYVGVRNGTVEKLWAVTARGMAL
ncbi:MAG: DSD1 family PLP-dependent enzyme [Paracoccaceae bacterium]